MSTPPTFRLSADFPHGVLPEIFGVVSAADPPDLASLDPKAGLPGCFF